MWPAAGCQWASWEGSLQFTKTCQAAERWVRCLILFIFHTCNAASLLLCHTAKTILTLIQWPAFILLLIWPAPQSFAGVIYTSLPSSIAPSLISTSSVLPSYHTSPNFHFSTCTLISAITGLSQASALITLCHLVLFHVTTSMCVFLSFPVCLQWQATGSKRYSKASSLCRRLSLITISLILNLCIWMCSSISSAVSGSFCPRGEGWRWAAHGSALHCNWALKPLYVKSKAHQPKTTLLQQHVTHYQFEAVMRSD